MITIDLKKENEMEYDITENLIVLRAFFIIQPEDIDYSFIFQGMVDNVNKKIKFRIPKLEDKIKNGKGLSYLEIHDDKYKLLYNCREEILLKSEMNVDPKFEKNQNLFDFTKLSSKTNTITLVGKNILTKS